MRKRIISLLLAIVLVASCFPALKANAAVATQEAAVIQMLKSARFTVTDANTVGSWIDLAYYVGLVLETDNFDPDAVCSGVYFNALRVRANKLLRQNRVSKIPVYPFVKVSQQPEDLAPAQGEPAVLSVNATASNGTALSYQWYSCADENKTDAVLIEGATEATFTAPTEDFGVFYYFCRLSGTNMEDTDTNVICVDVALPTFEGSLPLSAFEYTVDADAGTVLLSKYIGTEKTVVVPPFYTVDGTMYKTVLDSTTVFYNNDTITDVKLHKGVSFANNTMANLFYSCSSLVSADLSGVNTTGVTDMTSVFEACTKLTTLDMTGIDTSSVTTMAYLFYNCKVLKSLTGYEYWDTSSLQNISGSFNAVAQLKTIDLSRWDLSQIESSRICFQHYKAEQILLPDNLKTINAFFMNHAEYIQGKTFTIPAGVEKIGYDHVFYNFGTSAFEEFIVADGNKNYKAIDGILYSADGKEMLAIPKGKTFENGVYEIPEGVEFLGMLSFSRNPYIKTVVIPNSLELKFVPARDPAYTLPGDNGNINPGNNLNLAIYCEGCSVSSYEVKADNPRYTSRKGVIYSKDMTTLVAIPTWYDQYLDIPEGVTSIAYEASLHGDTRVIAHMGKSTGVSIPSTLTNISPEQLKKLNDLRVKFPDTFKITVSPDNPAYAVDESGALVERDPFILISQQPEDLNPARGDQAILSVGASASNGTTLAYQWYSCTDEDKTDAAPIEGATDATYTVPTDMYGDFYYFCRISAEYGESVDSAVATILISLVYTYYSTWDSAVADVNNGTIGENADAEKENAVACIYLDNNNVANAVLLRDAETAGMEIAKDMVINLNGHKLSMTEGNITFAIRHTIGTLVVDGTKKGSSIEVKNSDKTAGCIRADAGTLTVNGGTYVATSGKSARPIQVDYDCTATITDCEITAFGGEKTASGGVLNWGIATLTNCRVSAYANYNTDQGEYSMGVYGDGPLILNNCYAYGTHSSVQCHNTLVINGGTYESPGHGVYISCTDKIAHIRNATIRFCEMKEGYIYTAGAMGPGLYIGGGSDRNNVTLYIDNCDIYSKTKNAQIILRGTSGEQNNKVYISNSRLHDLGGEKLHVRIDNLTHRLYLGAGNNFNKENTTIKALYDPNSMLPAVIETGKTYDSIP